MVENYKVEVWVERIHVSTILTETFANKQQAEEFIERDFEQRQKDEEFLNYGGYHMYMLQWLPIKSPTIIRGPTIQW